MGRIYTINGENMTLTTAIRGLAVISTAATGAGSMIGIHRIEIAQSGTATGQQIRGALSTRTGSTYTVTGYTPKPLSPIGSATAATITSGTAAAAGTSGINATVDTTPTYVDHYVFNFNNLNGWLYIPTPTEETMLMPSTVFIVRLLADPTTLAGWTICVTFEETG